MKEGWKKLQTLLAQLIPETTQQFLPKSWHRIGDLLIVQLHKALFAYESEIGEALLEINPQAVGVASKAGPTRSWARTPQLKLIAGTYSGETIHKENQCLFKLDPFKILFSPGNKNERLRMAQIVEPNEVVIDMFSCVGQFAIPIAFHASPKRVIAIEKNPTAYKYLTENIKLNKLEKTVYPILGDSLVQTPQNAANRVIMGLLPYNPKQYLRAAIEAIKPPGVIHYHIAAPPQQINEMVEKIITELRASQTVEIKLLSTHKIKKYSPGITHSVADLIVC